MIFCDAFCVHCQRETPHTHYVGLATCRVCGQSERVRWPSAVSSMQLFPHKRTISFVGMDTENLRDFCAQTGPGKWAQWSRAQLLAFCQNRWPCGYHVEESTVLNGDPTAHETTR